MKFTQLYQAERSFKVLRKYSRRGFALGSLAGFAWALIAHGGDNWLSVLVTWWADLAALVGGSVYTGGGPQWAMQTWVDAVYFKSVVASEFPQIRAAATRVWSYSGVMAAVGIILPWALAGALLGEHRRRPEVERGPSRHGYDYDALVRRRARERKRKRRKR